MIKNILCIGHNKAMNYIIKTVLGNRYKIVMVEDVFHGMNILKHTQDVNLVVIDIDYQTKESIDFIQHVNSSKLYNKPLIVLSSFHHQKTNDAVIEASVYDYFIKPFNPIEFVKSINKLNSSETVTN